jgi:RNA polymerase primary sigma factor
MASRSEFEELSPYLNQLSRSRVLTREEEVELSTRAKKGSARARDDLARHNLPFVVAVAKKHMGRGARLDDLIQEGNVGLLKAIEHFDPEKGNRFATYAVWWIRAYVTRYLKDNRSQVRGGEKERPVMRDLSLDATIGNDEDGDTSHLDRLVGAEPSPELEFLQDEHSDEVREALRQVKKRIGDLGWDILQERLSQDEPKTLEELGKRWGVSRERVRQVELKTKIFLSRYLAPLAA